MWYNTFILMLGVMIIMVDPKYVYENLNSETKRYLDKAMEIYSVIRDRDIEKIVRGIFGNEYHSFTKMDKKILSLYIASFLVDGDLKNVLEEYDDLKIKDFLSFAELNIDDIKPLEQSEYMSIYDTRFKLDLISILKSTYDYLFHKITPEIIYYCLGFKTKTNSKVLDYLYNTCNIQTTMVFEHPSFEAAKNLAITKGDLERKKVPERNIDFPIIFRGHDHINITKKDLEPFEKTISSPEKSKLDIDFDDEKIWSIVDDIQKKFIGQETAAEYLFYNIVNNQQLALRDDVNDGERSIIFLDGPTGTGKTAITREITATLGIPFISSSATNYSSTGYVGGNITDTLKELYKKANGNLEKAQRGIIVFDEFDKIAYSREGGLEMKKAVQQQLLDFMGGGKYNIDVGSGIFDHREVEFDTSKLTFVCLAALTDLRTGKTEKRRSMGFGNVDESNDNLEYSINPQDLINMGLERELVGRFNTYLNTDEYSKETLLKILKESTISPMIGFEKWVSSKGKKLEIADGVYEAIADAAYKLNTGARSLQTIMNNIRTHFLKEVLRGKNKVIYLDLETVLEITGSTFTRKGRR